MEHTTDFTRQPGPAEQLADNPEVSQRVIFPVIEEQLRVSKQVVEAGIVRISKTVHEEEVDVKVPVTNEEIDVERVAVNQYVESPPSVRYEGDTMIIPVLREVVEKRLVLVEELHVTRRRVQSHDSQLITLRREEVKVERIASDLATPTPD